MLKVMLRVVVLVMIVAFLIPFFAQPTSQGETVTTPPLPGPTVIIPGVPLVITMKDLPRGTVISADMVEVCNTWHKALIPELAVTDAKYVLGSKTLVDIPGGTPVIATQLIASSGSQQAALSPATTSACPPLDEGISVVVATRQIVQGEVISQSSFDIENWPVVPRPIHAVKTPESVIGKTALSLIPKGTMILDTQISGS